MDILLVSLAALFTAGLTFFSGFGLGTLLLPVFAIFFPAEIAVAATALVHFTNNIFKVALVGKHADKKVTLRFALPAAAAAFLGAWVLTLAAGMPPFSSYTIAGKEFFLSPIKMIIGFLMILFAIFELQPSFAKFQISRKYIPAGGALSGFFGGLSGNQGALRTAFLLKAGLTKESFIGTMVISSFIVDAVRITVYGSSFFFRELSSGEHTGIVPLIIAGCISAFAGSYIGKYLFEKVTFTSIKIFIASALFLFGISFAAGMI